MTISDSHQSQPLTAQSFRVISGVERKVSEERRGGGGGVGERDRDGKDGGMKGEERKRPPVFTGH